MSSFRTLALAAALIASAAPAFAANHYLPGDVATPAWSQADNGRTPLADSYSNAGQTLLEQSGATGGGGQHA